MFDEVQGSAAFGTPASSRAAPRLDIYPGVKRLLDLALAICVAPVAGPLILVLALMVMADGGSPFYSQPRLGKNGKIFRLWKLRSMVPNADALLQLHLAQDPAARAEWDSTQKLRRDPRITRIGRILRKYSLDELPQLWNVLTGEMSIVGPRPIFPEQRALYPGTAYFDFRPGLTGLWQITERNNSSFAQRATYDNSYAMTVSLLTDLRIIFKTVEVVFRGTGL